MTTEVKPLVGERKNGETSKATQACNDYLRLGSGRTLPKLIEKYQESSRITKSFEPPTVSYKTLQTWSSKFDWPSRAAEFDAGWEARKNAERQAVMDYGLALDYERVTKLKRLAEFLETQLYEQGADGAYHNLWVPDVKVVGRGDDAEVVDIERFNAPLVAQLRAVLDDLAKEVGDRILKSDLTSKGERIGPISLVEAVPPSENGHDKEAVTLSGNGNP